MLIGANRTGCNPNGVLIRTVDSWRDTPPGDSGLDQRDGWRSGEAKMQ